MITYGHSRVGLVMPAAERRVSGVGEIQRFLYRAQFLYGFVAAQFLGLGNAPRAEFKIRMGALAVAAHFQVNRSSRLQSVLRCWDSSAMRSRVYRACRI